MNPTANRVAFITTLIGLAILFGGKQALDSALAIQDQSGVVETTIVADQDFPSSKPSDTTQERQDARETDFASIEPARQMKEIVIFSADWCRECKKWDQVEKSKFSALGYSFAYGDAKQVRLVPHFIVTDAGKTVEISGYMTPARLKTELLR